MDNQRLYFTGYITFWIMLSLWLAHEYVCLNKIYCSGFPRILVTNPNTGSTLSYVMGWLGFSVILATNAYILRKRLPILANKGTLRAWLDFHIFCGLLGPTLIIFHTNFKVGGLVAISFWSMIISFLSGIVGRYLYMQLLALRVETKKELAVYENGFRKAQFLITPMISDETMRKYKQSAIILAGGTPRIMSGKADPFTALLMSLIGDIRISFSHPPMPPGFPSAMREQFKNYAILRRKVATTGYFQRLMGYWHTFHAPFAVFMYVVSVIHIVSALIFRVNH